MSQIPEFQQGRRLTHSMTTEKFIEAWEGINRDTYAEYEDDFVGAALRAEWATHAETVNGAIALIDAVGGVAQLLNSSDSEGQDLQLSFGDNLSIPVVAGLKVSFRALINFVTGTGFTADSRAYLGIGGAHATADLAIPGTHAFFKIGDTSDLSIYVETDDTANDNDDIDTGVDIVDNTYVKFEIDFTDLTDVRFFIDDAPVALGTTFDMSTVDGNGVQPLFLLYRDGNAVEERMEIDSFKATFPRQ